MNLFAPADAQHYCASFAATPGLATGSFREYAAAHLKGATLLTEGSPAFSAYRDCALRDAERLMFLAVSQYRRFGDLMTSSAAPWAYVTVYYGSYYVASALLAMFGGWINNRTMVDVATSTAGHQSLQIARKIKTINQGSHRVFWECFYDGVQPLYPWVDPALVFSLQPVAGSVTWQIDNRNLVNYDSFSSHGLIVQFHDGFRRSAFPNRLPGILNTQFRVFEGLMLIVCGFMRQFGLATDVFVGFPGEGARRARVRSLIFEIALPNLGTKMRRQRLLV
jgi:hypothetical protein